MPCFYEHCLSQRAFLLPPHQPSHHLLPTSRSFRLPSPTAPTPAPKMGVSWSSVSECLGDFSDHHSSRYNRVPPSRRVEQSAISSSRDRAALRQRCVSEEKLTISAASPGAAIAPPPPPLVPDSNAVYNLLEDEDEDVCPTCLETYASDNPKITSTCGHAFHLQCIVAWETRSGTRFCPICAKVMEYVEADQPSRSKTTART